MVRRTGARLANSDDVNQEMPTWASKLIERFDSYSVSIERSLSQAFDCVFRTISDLQETQNSILDLLSKLETKISLLNTFPSTQQSNLYAAMVKVRADSSKIDEKLKTIAWVGIDEKVDERSTCRFDREIVKEAVYTSGCDDLIREFEEGRISIHRHPDGRPRGRGRMIKIPLSNQALRDSLLSHMKSGRQSLTQELMHSFARRDYTVEELSLDRSLRKQAGDLNAQAAKLLYVVRDFDIVKLKTPRDLPKRPLTLYPSSGVANSNSRTKGPQPSTPSPSSCGSSNVPLERDGGLSQNSHPTSASVDATSCYSA
ncbi:hypothetical protein ANCDUO_00929 [Ancylostoma duodenale]|uniref:Uncharacterized protein n=1 Tax=Ancylostoma duodenale TaxID=51022 RepID=A0A0C2DFG4_9BILA|nr:hypothetical protein ANCDUO_00929 [Ancylostoma duodenale]